MSVNWPEFDEALYGFLLSHLKRLAKHYETQVSYEVLIHCSADYGEAYAYLGVRPQGYGTGEYQFPGYPNHPPRNPDGLCYTLNGWHHLEIDADADDSSVKRWNDWCNNFRAHMFGDNHDRLRTEFLERACLAALRVEQETSFAFLAREPSFVLMVEDHDEYQYYSWRRLVRARIRLSPPWDSAPWPIAGRHPDLAAVIFAFAATYHERGELIPAAHLLREAIARLPELQNPNCYRVEGTDVDLPVPEHKAWARAHLALAEEHRLDENLKQADIETVTQLDIDRALQLDPDLADAYYLHAQRLSGGPVPAADLDAAVAVVNCAIALDMNRPNYFALRGSIHERPFHPFWEEAIRDYSHAIALDPINQCWLMRRGDIFARIGDHAAAIEDYSRVFELRESKVSWYVRQALIGRADSLQALGNYRAALEDWNRLIAYEKSSRYYLARATCFRNVGDERAATEDEKTAQQLQQAED